VKNFLITLQFVLIFILMLESYSHSTRIKSHFEILNQMQESNGRIHDEIVKTLEKIHIHH